MYVSPLEGNAIAARQSTVRSMPVACGFALSPSLLLGLLEEIDYGMLVLDASARVLHMNQLARLELLSGKTVCVVDERLTAHLPQDQVDIARALADSARGVRSLLPLGSHSGRNTGRSLGEVTISFIPLCAQEDSFGPSGGYTLAMLSKRESCEPLTLQQFGRHCRLTQCEQALLPAIMLGLSAEHIAAQSQTSVNTVRTHLGHIRAKTRVTSMRQLATVLTKLPPIRPLVKSQSPH